MPDRRETLLTVAGVLALVARIAVPADAHERFANAKDRPSQGLSLIIVKLREPRALRNLADGTESGDAAYEQANLALQSQVIASVFGRPASRLRAGSRRLEQFESVAMFSIMATPSEIAALRADRRVRQVHMERLFRPN